MRVARKPGFLFVCGLGRSGTTALTDCLTRHRHIVLGMERYKRLCRPRRIGELQPELFHRERFFDFSDGLTNITPALDERWDRYYTAAAAKYRRARYVGDKLTSVPIDDLLAAFPQARFVCIVREVLPMAFSWQQRASNPEDHGWSENRDAWAAVDVWNQAMHTVLRAQQARPNQVAVVNYDKFFGGDQDLNKLMEFLALKADKELLAAHRAARAKYLSSIVDKDRALPPDVTEHITRRAATDVWRELIAVAM